MFVLVLLIAGIKMNEKLDKMSLVWSHVFFSMTVCWNITHIYYINAILTIFLI